MRPWRTILSAAAILAAFTLAACSATAKAEFKGPVLLNAKTTDIGALVHPEASSVPVLAPEAPPEDAKGVPTPGQLRGAREACSGWGGDMRDACTADLMAMAQTESNFDCALVGDQGRSYGCFQIQIKMHGVTAEQARDFAWAARWTLDRMTQEFGYPKYRTSAIRAHNGAGVAAVQYAERVKARAESFKP